MVQLGAAAWRRANGSRKPWSPACGPAQRAHCATVAQKRGSWGVKWRPHEWWAGRAVVGVSWSVISLIDLGTD